LPLPHKFLLLLHLRVVTRNESVGSKAKTRYLKVQ
ncbi:hypothetical protein BAE44_0003383, partial [Dichanthelium oligosanthes]